MKDARRPDPTRDFNVFSLRVELCVCWYALNRSGRSAASQGSTLKSARSRGRWR